MTAGPVLDYTRCRDRGKWFLPFSSSPGEPVATISHPSGTPPNHLQVRFSGTVTGGSRPSLVPLGCTHPCHNSINFCPPHPLNHLQVRFSGTMTGGSRLVFMTEGILLRMMAADPQVWAGVDRCG